LRGESIPVDWIRPLAAPYLRGFQAYPQRRGSLRGFWFLHSASVRRVQGSNLPEAGLGFFVGYLEKEPGHRFLRPQLPECLIFAFMSPAGGRDYRRLVSEPGSLLRKTFEYIRWLTHRPPRFEFYEGETAVMVRHQSMREWPVEKRDHFSRNFFVETLAWLVRSALVRKLHAEFSTAHRASKRSAKKLPQKGSRRKAPR
jgi:hypothetical protein